MIFGLGAALAWGMADLGAALVSRRIGSFVAVVVAQVTGAVTLSILFFLVRPAFHPSLRDLLLLVANGAVAAAAYVALFRALELGPVALVSPIVAAYGAVAVLLAVVVLGESLAGWVLTGVLVTLVGVVLSSTDVRRLGRATGRMEGVPPALLSLVLFGVASFLLGRLSQEMGWVPAVAISRTTTGLVLLGTALPRRRGFRGLRGMLVASAVAVGLADAAGLALYARGAQLGLISVVAVASATFTLIPVVGGLLLLHERPAASQAVGVVLVVGGLLMLGLS